MPQRTPGPAADPVAADGFPPELVDGGPVLLRRVQADDAAGIAAAVARSLDHLRPWMPWANEESATLRAQVARVAEASELWESGTDYIYSLIPAGGETAAGTAAIAGQIGLHRRAGEGALEIGYWVAAQYAYRGLGTAAARALTPVALSLPGITRVEIHCDEANTASAAIPRKLGYRLDRISPHEQEAPGECGQRMIWVKERPEPGQAGR